MNGEHARLAEIKNRRQLKRPNMSLAVFHQNRFAARWIAIAQHRNAAAVVRGKLNPILSIGQDHIQAGHIGDGELDDHGLVRQKIFAIGGHCHLQ